MKLLLEEELGSLGDDAWECDETDPPPRRYKFEELEILDGNG